MGVTCSAELVPLPAVPSDSVRAIHVTVSRSDSKLGIRYRLDGDLDRLHVPFERPADARDRLWEHTCFELFIARAGEAAYHELNFAPYGACAVYAFDAYRVAGKTKDLTARTPGRRWSDAIFELDAEIDIAALRSESLELGVSAVIEDREGRLSYWALAHPAERPDFHHRAAFTLRI